MIRRQPPVYSPLSLGALLRSSLSRGAEAKLKSTIRERFAVEDVLLCGSGTQALELAIRAACGEAGAGQTVALPAFACYDLASAAIGADVRVLFYDVDPGTLLPDLDTLEHVLERGPAAVVVASLFGYQPDWGGLRTLTEARGVTLIEDAAQSFGALWDGRAVGGMGDLSVLSFGRGKGWTAGGGGALLGRTQDLTRVTAACPLSIPGVTAGTRNFITGLVQWGFGRPLLYGIPSAVPGLELGETVYHPPVRPRALSPRSAQLALSTLKASTKEVEIRRARAHDLTARVRALERGNLVVPRVHPRSEPGFLRLPVTASPPARAFLAARGRAMGIMPSYPLPLPELAQLRLLIADERNFAGASELAQSLVTLPTHSMLRESDLGKMFDLLRSADGC